MVLELAEEEGLALRQALNDLEFAKKIHHNALLRKLIGERAIWPDSFSQDDGLLPKPQKD